MTVPPGYFSILEDCPRFRSTFPLQSSRYWALNRVYMLMFSLHIRWSRNGSLAEKSLKRCSTSHHEPDNFSSNQNRQKDGKSHVIFVPKLEFPCLICGQLKACGQQMQFLADHLIPINRLLALSFIWQIANNRVILALKLTKVHKGEWDNLSELS